MNVLLGQIDPVAFEIGPLSVAWYGIIIASAMLLAVVLSSREADRLGFEKDIIIDLAFWIIPFGILGARLYYVIFELDYYLQNPLSILSVWEGGLAIYGGIIAGFFTIIWFVEKREIEFWLLVDIITPNLMLAQSIGRWGNFVNQEAHGGEVSRAFLENLFLPEFIIKGMHINGTYYHPTFLYESLVTLTGFIVLFMLTRKAKLLLRGEVISLYLIWYGIGRFFIEGLRTDSLYIGSIRVSQALSVVLVLVGIGIIIYRRFYSYPTPPYYSEGIYPDLEFEKQKENYYNAKG